MITLETITAIVETMLGQAFGQKVNGIIIEAQCDVNGGPTGEFKATAWRGERCVAVLDLEEL